MLIKKSLEKPTLIMGVEMGDLMLYLITSFGFVIVLSIMRTFMPIPGWINLILIAVLVLGFITLRKMTKKEQTSFLKSWLFWHLSAPKKIIMDKPRFIRVFQEKMRNHV
jgi:Type IV secretory pathway, VirB3-like protein